MTPFPLYLNEQSLTIHNLIPAIKLEVVMQFIKTLQAAKLKRKDLELHNAFSIYECDLGEGDYLCTILKGNNFLDHWRFIKNLVQKSPWDEQNLSIHVYLNSQKIIVIALALENHSATISLSTSAEWNKKEIILINADTQETIPNLSNTDHVNQWSSLFRDFGIDTTGSSVVFQDVFTVRMYQREHNPPHVHIECSGYAATIDIRRRNILGGSLPKHISSNIFNWVQNNETVLLENWDRCRAGTHPITIT